MPHAVQTSAQDMGEKLDTYRRFVAAVKYVILLHLGLLVFAAVWWVADTSLAVAIAGALVVTFGLGYLLHGVSGRAAVPAPQPQ